MVRFQVLDFDTTSNVPDDLRSLWPDERSSPWIRICGRTADAESVVLYVAGFVPYLWVEVADSAALTNLPELARWIATKAKCPVRNVTVHSNKCSLWGNEPVVVARIDLEQPNHVPKVRDLWHQEQCPTPLSPFGRFRVFEANVPYHMRFAIDNGGVPHCWCEVDDMAVTESGDVDPARCDLTLGAMVSDVVFDTEDPSNAPMPLAAIDGEMIMSGDNAGFPTPELAEVIQLGCCLYLDVTADATPTNLKQRVIFTRGDEIAPFPKEANTFVKRCATEKELLLAFRNWVNQVQPDFITGYNLDKFDWPFLLGRAKLLGIDELFRDMGKVPGELLKCERSHFQSGARGQEDDDNITIPGIVNVDMLRIIRNSEKLRSYKLDAVVKETFGEQEGKVDVHHTEIPVLFRGSPEDRRKLCEYCIYDAELAARLLFKKKVIVNHIEMARVTGVGIHALITGGQQIKVYNQILRECRPENLIVPTAVRQRANGGDAVDDNDNDNSLGAPLTLERMVGVASSKRPGDGKKKAGKKRKPEYEGATVIDPIKGFYQTPITTLDFSSLYPSIMREHNLCFRSIVLQGTKCPHGHDAFASQEVLGCCVKLTPYPARFWRQHVVDGMLPRILTNLLNARKRAKAEMARETDAFKRAVLDGRQLALKISANSVYGFTGATVGILPCIEISASVTGYGRDMIHYIQGLVERKYRGAGLVNQEVSAIDLDTQVVYGDSVSGDTPLLICTPDDTQVWLTASHLELFMGETYHTVRRGVGRKQQFLPTSGWRVWSSTGWTQILRVIRHRAPGKRMLRITTATGQVAVTEDHSLLRPDGEQVRPRQVQVGDALMHRDLPTYPGLMHRKRGECAAFVVAGGVGRGSEGRRYTDDLLNKLRAAERPNATPIERAIAAHIANTTGLSVGNDDDPILQITEIGALSDTEWVYDLETATHHFAAGIGRLVVHNTDSIMVNFGVERVADAMSIGKDAAELINAAFRIKSLFPEQRVAFLAEHAPTHQDMEAALLADTVRLVPLINKTFQSSIGIVFEKVLYPYLLISKKRYVGGFYTGNPDVPDKVHQSGIESVRRDNALFTAQSMSAILETLMRTKDPFEALAQARMLVRKLCTGRVPLDELIISKGFSKKESDYANPDGQPHLRVNKKREERERGSAYRLGERIPYVVIGGKVNRLVDHVEDPDYVRKHNIPVSIDYYLHNQIEKPFTRVFDTIWGDGASAALIFTAALTAKAQPSMSKFFGLPETKRELKELQQESADEMRKLVETWKRLSKKNKEQPSLYAVMGVKK